MVVHGPAKAKVVKKVAHEVLLLHHSTPGKRGSIRYSGHDSMGLLKIYYRSRGLPSLRVLICVLVRIDAKKSHQYRYPSVVFDDLAPAKT